MIPIRPECDSRRLFLQTNRGRTKWEEFFKNRNLSKSCPESSVKNICNEAGVKGSGLNDCMTNCGLRSSMTCLLAEWPLVVHDHSF